MLEGWNPKGIEVVFKCGHLVIWQKPFPELSAELRACINCHTDDVWRISEIGMECYICHSSKATKEFYGRDKRNTNPQV